MMVEQLRDPQIYESHHQDYGGALLSWPGAGPGPDNGGSLPCAIGLSYRMIVLQDDLYPCSYGTPGDYTGSTTSVSCSGSSTANALRGKSSLGVVAH